MFYGIIQRGLDKWNASFFCGSAAVLSRAALNETDGFSGVSITEDCETAVALHASGWNSIYVDKPLIAGLQPATFASFIGQRSRWAQGMMQILRFRFPPAEARPVDPAAPLLHVVDAVLAVPVPARDLPVAPLFYLFFDLQIFTASGGEFMAYTLTYMLVNLMMQNYLYGAFRWPWISELYEYVQTIHLLPAVISVILNPRKPTFKVTAKDESIDRSRLSEISTAVLRHLCRACRSVSSSPLTGSISNRSQPTSRWLLAAGTCSISSLPAVPWGSFRSAGKGPRRAVSG